MAGLFSNCPKCRKKNKVVITTYMRLDMGTGVVCERCHLRFHAILYDEDVKALFDSSSISPVVKGETDYVLNSEYYPSP